MKKILRVTCIFILMIGIVFAIGYSTANDSLESFKLPLIEMDPVKYKSHWTNIPIVSREILTQENVTIGGEGGQWPLVLATSKDGKYMFYGTDTIGIFRSTDQGKTWDKSMKNLTSNGVSDIVVDPNNSNRVLILGINVEPSYTTGIYLSEDGGETWSFKQNFMISGYRDTSENLAFDETSYDTNLGYSTIAYISLIYEKDYPGKNRLERVEVISDSYTDGKSRCNKAGLYKTIDGGETWNMVSNTLYDGIVKVNNTGTLYIAKTDGLYRSKDKGETFEKLNSDYILGLDIVNGIVYYSREDGIYYSEDDGNSFSKIENDHFPQEKNKHPINLKVSPMNQNNMMMFYGEEPVKDGKYVEAYEKGAEVYYTSDGGKTWNKSKYDTSADFFYYVRSRVSNFIWSPIEENKVWDFEVDWISSSKDGGKTFRWDANGITATLVGSKWHFNLYNSDIIYLGAQDYNGFVTLDGGKTWKFIDLATYSNEYGEKTWKYNGNVYAGYAADEMTYFGATSITWGSTKYLTITHDGGNTHTAYVGYSDYALSTGYKDRLLSQKDAYSSYQSPTNPKILFCGDLRSEDGGYTWTRMTNNEGQVVVTGVYTHDSKTGRLFGINDYGGYVVYSDDDGRSWERYNQKDMNPYTESPFLESLSYDSVNDRLYVAWNWTQLSVISENGEKITELTSRIPPMLQFEGAPTKEQIGSLYNARRIRCVAVDPNNPIIVYAGGSTYGYRGDSDLYRSLDGGTTWEVVSINGSNSIVSTEDGDYGGISPVNINVKPETGELWVSSLCAGLSKLSPPYQIVKKSKVVTHYYLENSEIKLHEDKIIEGFVGENYQTERVELDGYQLKDVPSNSSGKIVEGLTTVTYYYKKIESAPTEHPLVPTPTNSKIPTPAPSTKPSPTPTNIEKPTPIPSPEATKTPEPTPTPPLEPTAKPAKTPTPSNTKEPPSPTPTLVKKNQEKKKIKKKTAVIMIGIMTLGMILIINIFIFLVKKKKRNENILNNDF